MKNTSFMTCFFVIKQSKTAHHIAMERIKFKNLDLYTISKYFNLYIILSFSGWVWETVYMLLLTGELCDRGFLTLPLCPIYGTVLLTTHFLLGNIREKRGIMNYINSDKASAIIYFYLCFLLPTIAEIAVGAFFLELFNMRLWDYSDMSYNTDGHIALEISVLWGAAIFIFMNKVFPKLKSAVFKIKNKQSIIIAALLALGITIDFLILVIKQFIFKKL